MEFQTLLIEINNRLATVTINRPDKLNSLNTVCMRELKDVFTNLKTNPDVDAVILTGARTKAFVSGTDIADLTVLDEKSGKEFSSWGNEIFSLIQHLGKPVIAAVNGYALGGGCELAMACHIRIASDTAKFGQPEVNLGVMPGHGGTQRLPRLVGIGKAMELILTGNQIDAQEALRVGLVNSVVPQAELLATAEALARTIMSKGQPAVRLALEAMNASLEKSLGDGLKSEAELFGACCATHDFKEGTIAFLEKRKPDFRGR